MAYNFFSKKALDALLTNIKELVSPATKDKAGLVKPDGVTIDVDEEGVIRALIESGRAIEISLEDYSNLTDEEKHNGIIYIIRDVPDDGVIPIAEVIENMGKLQTDVAKNKSDIVVLSNDLSKKQNQVAQGVQLKLLSMASSVNSVGNAYTSMSASKYVLLLASSITPDIKCNNVFIDATSNMWFVSTNTKDKACNLKILYYEI